MTTETFSVACAGAGYFAQFHHAPGKGRRARALLPLPTGTPARPCPTVLTAIPTSAPTGQQADRHAGYRDTAGYACRMIEQAVAPA